MKGNDNKQYVLITGGSQGIGKAIAEECARRKLNLLLIALPETILEQTAVELESKYQVTIHTFPVNLTELNAPLKVYQWCKENNYSVNILINNAGRAGTAIFSESTIEYNDERIMLNIRALVLLTRLFIPDMKKLTSAYILNIGSLSSYFPIPFKCIYSATKAFVLHFSKSLSEELRGTSIRVCVVCPNGVETNSETYSRIKSHGKMGELTKVSANYVAKISIKHLFKGKKTVIIPGNINKFILLIKKLVPEKVEQRILAREFSKEINA